jgi:hypothetical protein
VHQTRYLPSISSHPYLTLKFTEVCFPLCSKRKVGLD